MQALLTQYQPDLICLSHLRWKFVYQRPQHLMSRFAQHRRVFFVEEPVIDGCEPHLNLAVCPNSGVNVVTPHLVSNEGRNGVLELLLTDLVRTQEIWNPIVWFYTPMALEFFPDTISPSVIVYDCMDELSMFRGAPPQLQALEATLMSMADLVFTGGVSLFEAKRNLHPRMYPFPSGVDVPHFLRARDLKNTPSEQQAIGRPRLGYAGVIDERMDLALLDEVARERPQWNFMMIGPTAKIPPETLPNRPNIHWMGMKAYDELPSYFASWDIGMMPFALNDSTRFISPTKTPEYLAAGLPVISTAIRDVVRPYGELGLVHIAQTPAEFIAAAELVMTEGTGSKWRQRVDQFLESLSWNCVWSGMNTLISEVLSSEERLTASSSASSRFGSEPARV